MESESLVLGDKIDTLHRRIRDIEDQSLALLAKEKLTKQKITALTTEHQHKEEELKQYKLTYKDIQDKIDTLEKEITHYREVIINNIET